MYKLFIFILIGILSFSCKKENKVEPDTLETNTPNSFIDARDGQKYKWVKIGNQTWMAENLRATKYRNGEIIGTTTPLTLDISNEESPKYQWPSNGDENTVVSYGRLYTWFAATDERNLCPVGWHLPSTEEWTTM
jgi:uncharacterized protein (TIGR02145 family)